MNHALDAAADSYEMDHDTQLNVDAPGVLGNDTDIDGDSLTSIRPEFPVAINGDLVLNPDGSFSYTPDSGFTGTAEFRYQASDGSLKSPTVRVIITVDG